MISSSNLDEVIAYASLKLSEKKFGEATAIIRAVRKALPEDRRIDAAVLDIGQALTQEYADFMSGGDTASELVELYTHGAAKRIRVDRDLGFFSELASATIREGRSCLHFDRLYTIYQSLLNVRLLPGVVVELGVYRGARSSSLQKCVHTKKSRRT